MYSRNEAAQLKQEFWTVFGKYMTPVFSAEGEKISWINYKTGEKNIFFRLYADAKKAGISIELSHQDVELQQLYYEQFVQLKKIFIMASGDDWIWELNVTGDDGKIISKIYKELTEVSVFKKEDWPKLIPFFKSNMIALDEFWSSAKYSFELLR
ncbi:MAG: hypothetical protein JWR72_1285 [Flavisolibacter sp.]|nr:hypothetical protein [Flavisolibacter sp.]